MRVPELKALTRECGLRGYSGLRKAEIIKLIRNRPHGPGSAQWAHNQQSWAPDIPPRDGVTPPGGVHVPRPPQPTRPPPPPPIGVPPFKPRKVGEELKTDLKNLKCMKKKLGDLNRKIRHSKKKYDGQFTKETL